MAAKKIRLTYFSLKKTKWHLLWSKWSGEQGMEKNNRFIQVPNKYTFYLKVLGLYQYIRTSLHVFEIHSFELLALWIWLLFLSVPRHMYNHTTLRLKRILIATTSDYSLIFRVYTVQPIHTVQIFLLWRIWFDSGKIYRWVILCR